MMEVELTGQCGHGNGQNSNEAVAGTALHTVARWLHVDYARRTAVGGAYRFAAPYLVLFPSPPLHRHVT